MTNIILDALDFFDEVGHKIVLFSSSRSFLNTAGIYYLNRAALPTPVELIRLMFHFSPSTVFLNRLFLSVDCYDDSEREQHSQKLSSEVLLCATYTRCTFVSFVFFFPSRCVRLSRWKPHTPPRAVNRQYSKTVVSSKTHR